MYKEWTRNKWKKWRQSSLRSEGQGWIAKGQESTLEWIGNASTLPLGYLTKECTFGKIFNCTFKTSWFSIGYIYIYSCLKVKGSSHGSDYELATKLREKPVRKPDGAGLRLSMVWDSGCHNKGTNPWTRMNAVTCSELNSVSAHLEQGGAWVQVSHPQSQSECIVCDTEWPNKGSETS